MAQKTNKQIELDLIKKLYEMDGYFAAAFTKNDIAQMENNINADYDLLCGTTRDESEKVGSLQKELKTAYEKLDKYYRNTCDLLTERDAAIENYRAAQKDLKELREDYAAVYDKIEEKATEVEELNKQLDEYSDKIQNILQDNDSLQDDLYEKAHEIERLKFQIIRRDLQLGRELTEEQRQNLIETLEGYEN